MSEAATQSHAAPECVSIQSCRVCGTPSPQIVLELGELPLANSLLTEKPSDPGVEPRFPLTLAACSECGLAQILETVRPDILFRDYLYFSSFSETMLAHAQGEVEMLIERRGLGKDSLAVEIASNDGYLLKNFVEAGVPVLGVEPARNIAEVAEAAGVRTVAEFFDAELAQRLVAGGERADVILGNNVLAHVADLHGVVEGVATLLKPNGVAVFEMPYVRDMVEHLEFDTIYHEHLCYFSLHALQRLFAMHGLRVTDVERHPIHGGSLRMFAEPEAAGVEPSEAVRRVLAEEKELGIDTPAYYAAFADRVNALGESLRAEVDRRLAAGQTLAAYGASAKGSTLMNFFGLGREHLAFVADRSTAKQGHLTPGNHLPIVPPEWLTEPGDGHKAPNAVLLLTWNFAEEIARQQAAYLAGGGAFVVPVPEVHVIDQSGSHAIKAGGDS